MFWKLLKKSKPAKPIDSSISKIEWLQYFSGLLFDENSIVIDSTVGNDHAYCDDTSNSLNDPFTLQEIEWSISKLINGKSCGLDGIPSEFYKCSKTDISPIMLLLFNKILDTGNFPESWGQSIITPIHKSGPSNNPGNYRGISITNILYKIFSGIINKRLYDWAEENNKIDESQAGFR